MAHRILLVHPDDSVAQSWIHCIEKSNREVTYVDSVRDILPTARSFRPDVVVAELRLDDGPTLQSLIRLRQEDEDVELCIVTAYDSLASASFCHTLAVRSYHVKPIGTVELLQLILAEPSSVEGELRDHYMRLDRAIWEHINQTVAATGSIARAAEVLEVNRRSLRRMLSKYSPPV